MISVLYTIILITNFKLIEMCIKSSQKGREPNRIREDERQRKIKPLEENF